MAVKRRFAGKAYKTKAHALSALRRFTTAGWDECEVEPAAGGAYWRVRGIPPAFRLLAEITGTVEGVSSERAKLGPSYRWPGKR